jgi:hypothetical protein
MRPQRIPSPKNQNFKSLKFSEIEIRERRGAIPLPRPLSAVFQTPSACGRMAEKRQFQTIESSIVVATDERGLAFEQRSLLSETLNSASYARQDFHLVKR